MSSASKPPVKYDKKDLPSYHPEQHQPDTFLTRFINVLGKNISTFTKQVFGNPYQPLNNFSTVQKQKILDYLFSKNVMTIIELKQVKEKMFFRETGYPNGKDVKEKLNIEKKKLKDSEDRIESLLLIRKQLRSYFVNETSYEFNRARYVSMAYGFMLGVCIVLTIMRYSTPTRKVFACVTFSHFFGQYAIYRKMDYVFDQLYPLFQEDVKNAIRENKLEQFQGKNMKKLLQTLKL